MDEFDLTLTVSSEKVWVWKQQRNQCSGDVKWDDPLLRATIKIFVDWLNGSKVDRRVELEVLGEHLYNILFNGEVRAYFERQLEDARRAGQRLIVRLSFD